MHTIYIDILFLVNFAVTLSILSAQAILFKHPTGTFRIIAGALAGGLYSCVVFAFNIPFAGSMVSKVVMCPVIVGTSFGFSSIRSIIKKSLIFTLLTASLAMLMLFIIYSAGPLFNIGGIVHHGFFYFDIPLHFVLLCCTGACIGARVALKISSKSVECYCMKITVEYQSKKAHIKALFDTGNCLTDPFSGKPVAVTELKTIEPLFDKDTISCLHDIPARLPPGFRFIPFSSVGKENGLLATFVPDRVIIGKQQFTNLAIAVYPGTLSQNGDYNALIGPGAINRKDVTYA